jgi:peptide chain release factor 2
LENKIEDINSLEKKYKDCVALIELFEETLDENLEKDVERDINSFERELEEIRLKTLLKGKYDDKNAILTIHAGAGGTEAQDWANMLFRTYSMYADKAGFNLSILDVVDGDEAGIKSITFLINGDNAYGYLKAEKGVHRLVRISPFDANARRHTSFASVEAIPEIEDAPDIKIKPEELRVDTYRSSGAGGQHVK